MARKSTGRTGKRTDVRRSSSTRAKEKKKSSSQRESSRRASSHHEADDRKVVSISSGRKQSSAQARPSGRGRTSGDSSSAQAHALTDHDEIRQWAEDRGAHPVCIRGTGDRENAGMIQLDFPGYSGEGSLEEIGWDDWFDKFDESGLALLVREQSAGGQRSNFNRLVKRETTKARRESSKSGPGRGAA